MSGYAPSLAGLPFRADCRRLLRPSADLFRSSGQARRGVAHWVLAFRLAWRQLRSEPARSAAAITGIMFATMPVLMQLGFRGALFDTAIPLPQARHRALPNQPADDGAVPRKAIPRLHGFQALLLPEVILGIADRVPTWGTTGSALNIRPKGTRRTSSWMAM